MKRILRHLTYPRWRISQAFPKTSLNAIEAAIKASESTHQGELRFVVEGGLGLQDLMHKVTPRQRAIEAFSQLRVWDTEGNSGVLIYVQLADRQVEILADRGIHKKVGSETWQNICASMERAFRAGKFQEGALEGIQSAGRTLAEHFPIEPDNPDELPNEIVVL